MFSVSRLSHAVSSADRVQWEDGLWPLIIPGPRSPLQELEPTPPLRTPTCPGWAGFLRSGSGTGSLCTHCVSEWVSECALLLQCWGAGRLQSGSASCPQPACCHSPGLPRIHFSDNPPIQTPWNSNTTQGCSGFPLGVPCPVCLRVFPVK